MHGATIKMTQQYLYVSDYYPFKEELQVESYIILNSYRAVNTFHLGYKTQLMLQKEIITVSEIHIKHLNIFYVQNMDFFLTFKLVAPHLYFRKPLG